MSAILEFKGQKLGKEPDPHFFERLAEMPVSEAYDELSSAKIWAVWKRHEYIQSRDGKGANAIDALLTRLNVERARIASINRNHLMQVAVSELFGADAWAQVLVVLAEKERARDPRRTAST